MKLISKDELIYKDDYLKIGKLRKYFFLQLI